MERAIRVVVATMALAVSSGAEVHAGVYKWRDAQGNWQFSDRPPPSSSANGPVQEVKLHNGFADAKVSNKVPIANSEPGAGAVVSLDSFALKLDTAGSRNATIGRAFSGKDCSRSTELHWSDEVLDLKGKRGEEVVAERFRKAGYAFAGSVEEASGMLPDLHLDAELAGLKFDVCDSIVADGRIGQGSRAYVKVRWVLRDASGGDPLFSGSSAGTFDAWRPGGGTRDTALRALGAAVDNLLGERAFVDRLLGVPAERSTSKSPEVPVAPIAVQYGDGSGSFRDDSGALLDTALTVKTRRGHGSGVLIDNVGHALTNAHVVGTEQRVTVMLGDDAVDARVLRVDRRADVALLAIDPRGRRAASIARSEPRVGDALFVVGTPLDLQLSHTVTQGILSAVRVVDGARLFQTDAAVNRGNSGGPVFNEAGELVALSVSSMVNGAGASLNVNYLIPVDRALAAVGAGG